MTSEKPTLEIDPLTVKDRSLPILITAGILALLANVIFFLTYPINVGQSDNPTYLAMIITGTSNLMYASGYPAIVHLLAHQILPILPPVSLPHHLPSDISSDWYNRLQSVQLLLHLTLFSISIFLCAKVFSKSAATILALGWGCNVLFISNVDATAPEWLQGHALLLSILMHAYARKLTARNKILIYCLAAGVFALAYLIKPNALLFAISLFLLLLLDKESWGFKTLQLSGSVTIFLLLTSAYASFYHYKSTGTTQLNFDHAWVLVSSLPDDYFSTSIEQLGVNSLRWATLLRVTPQDYMLAGGIDHVEYGPQTEIRKQYQQYWEHVFHMSREEMVKYIKGHPLGSDYDQGSAPVSFYFYYGLEKTDVLGTQVYIDSVRSRPWYYVKKIVTAHATFIRGMKGIQTFPTFADPIGYKFLSPDFDSSLFGESKLVPPPDNTRYFLQYYNPRETVSFYGANVVELLNDVTSASFLYIPINTIALVGLFKLKSVLDKITTFSLVGGVLVFVSASGMLVGLRHKEIIAITPVYFLLISIGLLSAALRIEGYLESR
jgi:hypothetical protein